MRIKSAIKNSLVSMAAQMISFLMVFINRRMFIQYLSLEYLGYNGLFSSIFSLLSLAELGVGSVITYNLYREIADGNTNEINKLMTVYKYIYRMIGSLVFVIGLILYFFLPYIIKGTVSNWGYVRIVYLIQLATVLLGYFLSYRRAIFIAYQRDFVCVRIDLMCKSAIEISRLFIIVYLRDFTLYLVVDLIGVFLGNLLIAKRSNVDYAYMKKKATVTQKDMDKWEFGTNIRNFIVHKMANIVYSGTDSIVISMILGINTVALYSNYWLVTEKITSLVLGRLLGPLKASIGNLVYSKETKEKGVRLFFAFDLCSFFLAAFAFTSFLTLLQPLIQLWLGEAYLLPFSFVLMTALYLYVRWVGEITNLYRCAFGDYQFDRIYMMLSAICNLIVSIVGVTLWGVTGVAAGTFLGMLFMWFGRMRFVFNKYLEQSCAWYVAKHLVWFVIAVCEGVLVWWLASFLPITFGGFLGKLALCIFVPNTINFFLLCRSKDFKTVLEYMKSMLDVLKKPS